MAWRRCWIGVFGLVFTLFTVSLYSLVADVSAPTQPPAGADTYAITPASSYKEDADRKSFP